MRGSIVHTSECDFIIIERPESNSVTDMIMLPGIHVCSEKEDFKKMFKDGLRGFGLIKTFQVPMPNENSTISIYKREL